MRNTKIFALAGLLVVAGLAPAQQRQQGGRGFGGGGGIMLLGNKSVQEELKLDEGQVAKLKELGEKTQTTLRETMTKLRDAGGFDPSKMAEAMKPVQEEAKKSVATILKPEQLKRFHQIDLQTGGVAGVATNAEVQTELGLSDDQKSQLKSIAEESAKEQRSLFGAGGGDQAERRKKMQALREETQEKVEKVLTVEQRKAFKSMTGEPFELKRENGPRGTRPPA